MTEHTWMDLIQTCCVYKSKRDSNTLNEVNLHHMWPLNIGAVVCVVIKSLEADLFTTVAPR